MADIRASFMGIDLASPIIVGACTLSNRIDNIERAQYVSLLMSSHDPKANYGLRAYLRR